MRHVILTRRRLRFDRPSAMTCAALINAIRKIPHARLAVALGHSWRKLRLADLSILTLGG